MPEPYKFYWEVHNYFYTIIGAVRMQIAFGRVRRKTAPTGGCSNIFGFYDNMPYVPNGIYFHCE